MVKGRGKTSRRIGNPQSFFHVFNRRAKCCLVNKAVAAVHALVQVCPITKTELPWQLLSHNAIMLPDITVRSEQTGKICGLDQTNKKKQKSKCENFMC